MSLKHQSKYKKFSLITTFLLLFSLVSSPLQLIASAESTADNPGEARTEISSQNELDKDSEENRDLLNDEENEEKDSDIESDTEEKTDVSEEETDNQPESEDQDKGIQEPKNEELDNNVTEGEELNPDVENQEGIEENNEANEESSQKEDEDEGVTKFDPETFQVKINEVDTTFNSITISWSASQADVVKEYRLYLDGKKIETVSSDVSSYTFSELNTGEYYSVEVEAIVPVTDPEDSWVYEEYFWDYEYATPDWSEDDLIPVSLIVIVNEDLDYQDRIRIRGIDDNNKGFKSEWDLLYEDEELFLPLGKFDVTVYDAEDPSIAAVEQIEIKEGIDYIKSPIQLRFKLKEMREQADPFEYQIRDVTENSFTLNWDKTTKVNGFEISAWDENGDYLEPIQVLLKNNETNYTLSGLGSNITYSLNLLTQYVHDLEKWNWFSLKTIGEDAKAPKVLFASEAVKKEAEKELGIYLRDATVADMKGLQDLNVNYEDIDSLEGIEHATNLTNLNLYGNEISDISLLSNLTVLEYLDLDNNQIKDITALGKLDKLNSLYLRGNQITDVSELNKLESLSHLHLGNNQISDISALKNLTTLSTLQLYSNKITNIENLKDLKELTDLDLSDNNIETVESLSKLTQLESLDFANNRISDISALKGLTKLTYLEISANEISDIEALTSLTGLKYLYSTSNQLTSLPNLQNLKQLHYLSLYENRLTDISGVIGLDALETLYLGNNQLTSLPNLQNLKQLSDLSLYDNKLTDISGLAGLDALETLNLSGNELTDISVLKELPSLLTVYLYDMDITDTETLEYLRNNGVEVFFDGDLDDDWNDWEDQEDDEMDEEIDFEELLETFPAESGFEISEKGHVSLNLSNQKEKETIELTPVQTKLLIKNKQTLNVVNDDVEAKIPSTAFDSDSDDPVKINVKEMPSEPNSLSSTYDFTITQGTKNISQFDDGVMLTFNVNVDRVKDPNRLKVFYYNEDLKKWENIGGSYKNGKVTAVTTHFSKYAVFEVEEEETPAVPGEETTDEPTDPIQPEEPTQTEKDNNTPPANNDATDKGVNDSASLPEQEVTGDTSMPGQKQTVDTTAVTPTSTKKQEIANEANTALAADNKETEQAAAKTDKKNEANSLPNTATNTNNLLLMGLLLIALGGIGYIIFNRKQIKGN